MTTRWLLAKYMPDLRRREPRNVGIVLFHDGKVHARFRGESAKGSIDGRAARSFVSSQENYKNWIQRWRYELQRVQSIGDFEGLVKPPGAANYFLEPSGQVDAGSITDPLALLERLYSEVIPPDNVREDRSSELVNQVFSDAGILEEIEDEQSLDIEGDQLFFDHKFANGADNYFRKLTLRSSRAGWGIVHDAAWTLDRLRSAKQALPRETRSIALVSNAGDSKTARQLIQLESKADLVIDLEESTAAERLRALVHPMTLLRS